MTINVPEHFTLNNGVSIPAIGFGTYQIPPEKTFAAVTAALNAGYRHIDTAMIYRNEEEVGRAINESGIARDEIFVTTKLWNSDHADPMQAFETSLEKLDLEYVDLYLMHWPVPERNASWTVMQDILDEDLAKAIGVSNFTIRHLEELFATTARIPAVNQFEFSPFLFQSELLNFCNEHHIRVEAYSPLTRGKRMDDARIAAIAKAHKKSAAQVFLRWCLQHGTIPLPRSVTQSHIEENIDIFDFSLSGSEMNTLDSLNEGFRVATDPTNMP